MTQNWKKLLSLLLVLTMLVGMMPAVFAAEDEPEAEPEQIEGLLTEEPEAPEVPTEPETPEEPDTPDDPEEPDVPVNPDEPGDEPEEPAEPEPEDPAEEPEEGEETEEEEEEPAELPYGFPGMGEGYELSEAELAAKTAMAGLPEEVASMTPGVDYVAGELLFLTDNADYAQQVADAYDAELVYCGSFFARIRLRSATVPQAIECAADPAVPLPAVEPNYLAAMDAVPAETVSADDYEVQGVWMDREAWGVSDPWIADPSDGRYYQYHHDILDDYAAWGATLGSGVNVAVISYSYSDMAAALIADNFNGINGLV